jgi:hypothetical protein
MHNPNPELLVVIDSEIELLIQEINSVPNGQQQVDFIEAFQGMMVDQLMGPFGLTRAMFEDRDGGAVTTIHNFEKGITANQVDAERHQNWEEAKSQGFVRDDYDAALDKAHGSMRSPDGKFYDGYTPDRELPVGPRMTARDHVVAASEVERSSRGHLAQSREERVATATQEENVVLTSFNMNSSKSDADLLEWAERQNASDPSMSNTEYYMLDSETIKEKNAKANQAIDTIQDRAVFNKQMDELLSTGASAAGKLAVRQIMGLLLKDLIEGLVRDVRYLVREGFDGAESLLDLAQNRLRETYEKVRAKWAEYIKEGVSAGISGFLSNLLTLVINAFVTTAKNIVRLIREAVLSVVRAIKTIVSPPPGTTAKEIAYEVFKILSGTLAVAIGIALEEVIAKALQAIPLLAPFAAIMAPVIAGIVTGTLTLFTVLSFDRLRNNLVFQNKELADVHRGQAIGFLRIKQTVLILDSAYRELSLTGQSLSLQFSESGVMVNDARQITQNRIKNYRQAIVGLDDILEQYK